MSLTLEKHTTKSMVVRGPQDAIDNLATQLQEAGCKLNKKLKGGGQGWTCLNKLSDAVNSVLSGGAPQAKKVKYPKKSSNKTSTTTPKAAAPKPFNGKVTLESLYELVSTMNSKVDICLEQIAAIQLETEMVSDSDSELSSDSEYSDSDDDEDIEVDSEHEPDDEEPDEEDEFDVSDDE